MRTMRDRRRTPQGTSLALGDRKSIDDFWSSDAALPDSVGYEQHQSAKADSCHGDTASVKAVDRLPPTTVKTDITKSDFPSVLNGEGTSKDNARIISKQKSETEKQQLNERRKKAKNNHRVPVLNPDGTPAMPTTSRRANKWIKEKKAKKVRNKLEIFQVQLLVEPSGRNKQDIVVTVDPGSAFTGIGVLSKNAVLYGSMLELPGYKKGSKGKIITNRFGKKIQVFPNTIVDGMTKRRQLRRSRRYRKTRRRPSRWLNRSRSKISPSILARKQLELKVVTELSNIYPVNIIGFEDVKFNHYKDIDGSKGQFFSYIEIGKNWILGELKKITSVKIIRGYHTNIRRGQLGLKKEGDKSVRSVDSHVNDCVAMGSLGLGIETKNKFKFDVIARPKYSRRFLHLEQFSKGGVRRRYGGTTIEWTNIRKGDYVEAISGKNVYRSYVSGFTTMNGNNYIYVSDFDWKGFGKNGTQTAIVPSNIRILNRNNGFLIKNMVKIMTREELFSQRSGTVQVNIDDAWS